MSLFLSTADSLRSQIGWVGGWKIFFVNWISQIYKWPEFNTLHAKSIWWKVKSDTVITLMISEIIDFS